MSERKRSRANAERNVQGYLVRYRIGARESYAYLPRVRTLQAAKDEWAKMTVWSGHAEDVRFKEVPRTDGLKAFSND
jgi:hypothetical protein